MKLAESLASLSSEAQRLGESLRQERANQRFVPVLTEWLPAQVSALRTALLNPEDRRAGLPREWASQSAWLNLVLDEIRELVRQRRDSTLLPMLGDADALAERCYQPVIDFARAEGLPLASARPVAELSPFDLAIWSGFASTSLAPVFLPPGFFERTAWWPALAHEIGHDFLLSIPQLRDRLASELSLPGESIGTIPLQLRPTGITQQDLWRIHGGWFEELFADVFGTLMCGPAYVATMVELFSFQNDPREVLFVPVDRRTGRYDPHPPRHLRVQAGCAVLERAGFGQQAKDLLARWRQRNQLPEEGAAPLYVLMGSSWVSLPDAAVLPLTTALVERLYEGPHQALNGFGLQDISGLDYGPHEHEEALRAKADLLNGRVPGVRDPRAVIAGAVLAGLEAPEKDAVILDRARKAISAVGTFETAPSVFDPAADSSDGLRSVAGLDFSDDAIVQAIVLQEILQRRPYPIR